MNRRWNTFLGIMLILAIVGTIVQVAVWATGTG